MKDNQVMILLSAGYNLLAIHLIANDHFLWALITGIYGIVFAFVAKYLKEKDL